MFNIDIVLWNMGFFKFENQENVFIDFQEFWKK